MPAHHPPDGRQHAVEVELIAGANQWIARGRELENHEPGARLQRAAHLAQPRLQRRHVADAERHDRTIEAPVGHRQLQGIGRHRAQRVAGCLAVAHAQHRFGEVGRHDIPAEARLTHQLCSHVERAGAEIEIRSRRSGGPCQRLERATTPPLVDVHRQDVVEQIVARSDLGEDLLDVRAFLRAAGRSGIGAPEVGFE